MGSSAELRWPLAPWVGLSEKDFLRGSSHSRLYSPRPSDLCVALTAALRIEACFGGYERHRWPLRFSNSPFLFLPFSQFSMFLGEKRKGMMLPLQENTNSATEQSVAELKPKPNSSKTRSAAAVERTMEAKPLSPDRGGMAKKLKPNSMEPVKDLAHREGCGGTFWSIDLGDKD
ncbi:hypothetical protein Syun_001556 [Stephania yunnanensis]|uniref:Uncharacterized protein n=1 Tax=Stephania yunnanensis TaxID=152371 RepID=A0AAP0LE53_9MAGN